MVLLVPIVILVVVPPIGDGHLRFTVVFLEVTRRPLLDGGPMGRKPADNQRSILSVVMAKELFGGDGLSFFRMERNRRSGVEPPSKLRELFKLRRSLAPNLRFREFRSALGFGEQARHLVSRDTRFHQRGFHRGRYGP